jgi:hypothetical protein
VATAADMPPITTRSAIISSGGVLKPVSSSFRSNSLGAQEPWILSTASGALLHWEFAGVVGATNSMVLGVLEVVITFEFRGSTV